MKEKYSYMAVHSLVVFGNRRWRGPAKMYLNILLNEKCVLKKIILIPVVKLHSQQQVT